MLRRAKIFSLSPFGWLDFKHSLKQDAAQVALAGIGQDYDNRLTAELFLLPETHRRRHRRAAGDAGENSFFARQAAGHFDRFLVGYLLDPVNDAQIEIARDETRPDPLNLVRTRLERLPRHGLSDDRARYRLHGDRNDGLRF